MSIEPHAVILPKDLGGKTAYENIEKLLYSFDTSDVNDVNQHTERKCGCVGEEAKNDILMKLNHKYSPQYERIWKNYKKTDPDRFALEMNQTRSMFASEFQLTFLNNPDHDLPNKSCYYCNGTGLIKESQFLFSKYKVGGRWSGIFDGYNPVEDSNNIKKCTCVDKNGRPNKKCEICFGDGSYVVWPYDYADHEGDIVPVSKAKELKFIPQSIVTPDGKRHEELTILGDIDMDKWKPEVYEIYNNYIDNLVAVIDYY